MGLIKMFTELEPQVVTPVRWVKVNLEGGINIMEGDEGGPTSSFPKSSETEPRRFAASPPSPGSGTSN